MNSEDQGKESGVYENAKLIYWQTSIPLSLKLHDGQFRSMSDPPRSIRSQPDEAEKYQLTHEPRETTNEPVDAEMRINQGGNIHNQNSFSAEQLYAAQELRRQRNSSSGRRSNSNGGDEVDTIDIVTESKIGA